LVVNVVSIMTESGNLVVDVNSAAEVELSFPVVEWTNGKGMIVIKGALVTVVSIARRT
jgi:hypothetical protein